MEIGSVYTSHIIYVLVNMNHFLSCPCRWGRLRTTMMPWPGLLEPFTECLCLGVISALCSSYLFSVSVPLFLLLHTALWFCFDLLLIRTIEVGLVYMYSGIKLLD